MMLTIDSSPCDIDAGIHFDTAYDADLLRSPGAARTGRSVKLLLPRTAANDRLFGLQPVFNAALHTASLTHDGAQLHSGAVRLLSVSERGYEIDIRDGAAQWARTAAMGRFDAIPLNFTGSLTPTDISLGWSDARPVKFLPVLRDSYEQRNNSTDLQPIVQLLSPDDYHPFLQVDALVRAIFAGAGYTVESRFMEGELFRSLYMSGAYASRDTAAAEKRMGFCAVRLTSATATADAVGRVYAHPYGGSSALGNLVETATPLAVDENSVARTDPYNNGNCFGIDEQRIVYRPSSAMSIGFEYRLRFTSSHRILSRERLTGFDTIFLGKSQMPFQLPNRYTDRRDSLSTGASYRAMVFNAAASDQLQLRYTRNGVADTVWTEFTGRTAQVAVPSGGSVSNPRLFVRRLNIWGLYSGDWALYDGYIGETGQTTADITVRTAAETAGPSAPKYFDTVFFSGAEPGMKLTLHPECRVRPVFSSSPGYGAAITTADVAQHDIRQIVLLEAVQHLFNLQFYTDEAQKKVWIEPETEFWDESREADWRGRTDFTASVVWEDAALGEHESRTYGYRSGDGAAARLGSQEGTPFGSWQAQTGSYTAKEGDQKCTNPLFSPTLNVSEIYTAAPSARLMQVGDRDDLSGDGINFTPRIVRYCGLHPLPEGEQWGDPQGRASYPLAAFHFAGDSQQEGFTLCFADRDSQPGLHHFYDRREAIVASRGHVTLTLRIDPHEFETLFTPGTGMPDLRWVFRISTDRGDVRATLRRIGRYDPGLSSARCTFTLLPHDR